MVAILFHLWNPYYGEDGTLTFEVTQADTFRIHRGTRRFFDAALHALDVTMGGAYSWEITSGRSLYYSSYWTEDNWRDRWVRTWRVHIVPDDPLAPKANMLFRDSVALGESDNTWEDGDDDEDRYRHTAFIIVDFRKPRDEVEQLASAALARAGVPAALLEPAIRDLGNGVRQLQMVAREIDLPADVPALDALVASFKAAGGVVNWNLHPAWRNEPSEPLKSEIAAWLTRIDRMRKGE